MSSRGMYWLILQLTAIAAGIYAGMWVFEAVSS